VNKADPVGHEADGLDVLQPRYILTSHIVAMIGSAGWGLDQRASSARLGTSSAEGSVPSRPRLPDSPAGFPRVGKGASNEPPLTRRAFTGPRASAAGLSAERLSGLVERSRKPVVALQVYRTAR
jgi:hypothetical protein